MFFFLFIFFGFVSFVSSLEIETQVDSKNWWLAFYIKNVNTNCGSITNVEIRDCCSYSSWYGYSTYNHGYYAFNNNGNEFKPNIDVRITNSAGQKLVLNDIITNVYGGNKFSTSQNLCNGGTTPTPKPTPKPTQASAPTTPSPTSTSGDLICVDAKASNFNWKANNFKILLNGKEFRMKGVSWFGFETDTYIVHGLANWAGGGRSYKDYFKFLVDNKFNAIRLPFSQWLIQNNPNVPSNQFNGPGNTIFNGKKALQAMDIIIDEAAKNGILIMLDYHSVDRNSYTDGFKKLNQNTGRNIWKQLAQRYKNKWNVFMADIYNEPHDVSNGEWNNLWKNYCQNVGNDLISEGTNWLFAVQGTNWQCTQANCYWGENLQAVKNNPIILNKKNRVVYSPHVYGFDGNNAYSNSIWDAHFGYIAKGSISKSGQTIKAPVVVGEYGTKYSNNQEKNWLNSFINYLKNNLKQKNTFFWCLNANSGDTGGLLKSDWKSPETAKLNKLAELQPNPTKFIYKSSNNKVCWDDGSSSQNNAIASNNDEEGSDVSNFSLTQDTKKYDWSEWIVLLLIIIGCLSCLLCICFIGIVILAKKVLIKSDNEMAQKIGNTAIRYSVVVQRRFTNVTPKKSDADKHETVQNIGSDIDNNNIDVNMSSDGINTPVAAVNDTLKKQPEKQNQTNIIAEKDSDDE